MKKHNLMMVIAYTILLKLVINSIRNRNNIFCTRTTVFSPNLIKIPEDLLKFTFERILNPYVNYL